MSNLFSIFDPVSTSPLLSANWLSMAYILILPSSFWLMKSKLMFVIESLTFFLSKELSLVLGEKSGSMKMFLISLFMMIFIYNFIGLIPYVFTSTSHLSISMSLALPLWVGYFSLNFFYNTSSSLAHLVPLGTPLVLVPFMVLIEIVSNLMRPMTLSIRLAANMVAGHLLLSLLSSPASSSNYFIVMIILSLLFIMMILELSVSLIQSYVFMTLSSLYVSEVNNINNM